MLIRKSVITLSVVALTTLFGGLAAAPAKASETGAFIGGILAAKIGQNMRQRTQAEQQQGGPPREVGRREAPRRLALREKV